MQVIESPKFVNVKNINDDVYLAGDSVSINQYCLDNDYTLVRFELEKQRFSNDAGLMYQYYDNSSSSWKLEFGFRKVVTYLTIN
jgi:hypothetical protein